MPTLPAVATSLAASPQSMVDSGLPVETPAPVTTPEKPKTTQSKQKQDSTHPSPTKGSHNSEDAKGSIVSAARETKLESADGMLAPVATKTGTNSQSHQWDGVAAIFSMFLPKGSRPSDTLEGHGHPSNDPARGVVISAGSGVHTALSSQGSITLDGAPLVDGQITVISGQKISVKSGAVFVNGVPQHLSELRPSEPQGSSTLSGQEYTGNHQTDDALQGNGDSSKPGAVTAVDDANHDTHADTPDQGKHDAVFTVNGHTYSVESNLGTLNINGVPAAVGDTITTNGDVLTIGSQAISFQGTTTALPNERPEAATAGADVTIAHGKITLLKDGDGVLIAGTKLTPGQVTTIAGTRISIASNGVVVGYSTATFHELVGSTASAGTAITIDGTVYSASTMAGQPDVVLLAGQTLREGGPAVTIDNQVITNGPNGISIVKSTAPATITSVTNLAENVLVIDGTTYTATPVPGKSGVAVLEGKTLSVGGPAITIAGHLITEGSNGISIVGSTSMSSGPTSEQPSSTEASESSATTDNDSTSSEESSASIRNDGSGKNLLSFGVLFVVFMSL